MQFEFSSNYRISKAFFLLKLMFRATDIWQITTFDIVQKVFFCTLYSSTNLVLLVGQIDAGQYLWQGFIYLLHSKKCLEFWCILKEIGSIRKFLRQSVTKYFESFLRFSIVFLPHKWNGIKLLSPKSECTSSLASCRTT